MSQTPLPPPAPPAVVPAPPVFEKVPANASFPAIEVGILALWKQLDAFAESNRRRKGGPEFVFYDGPPFATGTPHHGHLLQSPTKDIVGRYWSMRGYHVERRFGWDCHGLPIESLAQQELGWSGASEIQRGGVAKFNETCRSLVLTYVAEWRRTVERLGRWVDFDRDYKTMDRDFMESVWWVFKRLWDKGMVYKAHRIMPYSPGLTTPLSNFEAGNDYRDVQDPAVTVGFRLADGRTALAWTTTPWTLPENLALCVGPDVTYVDVERADGAILVLAKDRLTAVLGAGPHRIVSEYPGKQLVGAPYSPLLPGFTATTSAFRIVADEFVTTVDGTGIVHMAPAYGEDDYRVCRREGIGLADPLDTDCRFTAAVAEHDPAAQGWVGRFCKDCDKDIIRRLKDEGKLFHQATIVHSYPFCERSGTPLIYRAIEAWYVRVEDMRDRLVAANQQVRWVPEFVGQGRFGNWLKEAKDWNISRNRFWGSCLPVWVNEADRSDTICVGSVQELERLAQLAPGTVTDLHKHHLDGVVIRKDGKTYRRTPEVLDCWFESGAMPYASVHWMGGPASIGEVVGTAPPPVFPAQFIGEAIDQTRGWFYTLLVLSTALFDRPAFQNVITTGLILAEDGQKMSKRKKNYTDPNLILDSIGADALRAYIVDSPVVRGEAMRFSDAGLREIVRTVVLPVWNALTFFTTYAVVDGYDPRSWPARPVAQRHDLDRWLLSVLQSLVRDVNAEMERYRLDTVVPRLVAFIDDLTNWYLRLSRRRFWTSADRAVQADAYATLYEALTVFAQVLAPVMPFLTEEIHQRLVRPVDATAPASVHWCDFPQADISRIDRDLETGMAAIRVVVSLSRKLREDARLKVRQPLPRLTVVSRDATVRAAAERFSGLLMDELNVKAIATSADEGAVVTVTVKPNFKELGKRCGPKLKAIGAALSAWGLAEVARLEAGGAIAVADEPIRLADVLLTRTPKPGGLVAAEGAITVMLDTALTPALIAEGHAREAISLIQQARKDAGLEVSDRIRLGWKADDAVVAAALRQHAATIADEVLALAVDEDPGLSGDPLVCNGSKLWIGLKKH